ncbi:hypothetical protein AURDEDRAFT_120634 [Auricularia subglabra TFB-10046 SS5]|nr:hypothetical protein AURDEDRAFT_120634 [Auricularia subglabra TFB-10046 SS5]
MAAPRNNLDQLRAKLSVEAASPAPVASKAQPTKARPALGTSPPQGRALTDLMHRRSSSRLRAVDRRVLGASCCLEYGADALGSPPQSSAPPAQAKPVSSARTGAQDERRQAVAQKRPSFDGDASPSKPSPPKKARLHEPEPAPTPSSSYPRSRPRDVVMTDDVTIGIKENLPTRPLTPQSPRKKAAGTSAPATRHALTPSISTPCKASSKPDEMTPEQLRILLATNLTSELDYVKKLILVQKGEAVDQDPFLLEQFASVLAQRNEDLKRTLAEKESNGAPRPPVQANADLSQMPLGQLRILLVQNLSAELQQTKAMLQEDGDIVMLEMFMQVFLLPERAVADMASRTMLEKRNVDTKAEIALREGRQPGTGSSGVPSFPPRITQPVFASAAPPSRYTTPTPTTSKSRYVPPDVIDISDDSMEVETVTTISTVEKTRIVVQPPSNSVNGPPLRAIENTECKGFCDNCKDSAVHAREFRDFTPQAQDAVRLVQELTARGDKATQAQIVNIFTGSKIKEIKDRGFESLEYFGKAGLTKVQTERVFEYLLVDGALAIESVRNNSGWSNDYLKSWDVTRLTRLLFSLVVPATHMDAGVPFLDAATISTIRNAAFYAQITRFEQHTLTPESVADMTLVYDWLISRLLDWVLIGARFSNAVLQALLVLFGRRPPKGRRLLIIATTSTRPLWTDIQMSEVFDSEKSVPPISGIEALTHVLREVESFKDGLELGRMRIARRASMMIVRCAGPALARGSVELVNLPDIFDSIAMRGAVARNYVKLCDRMVVVSPFNLTVAEQIARGIHSATRRRRRSVTWALVDLVGQAFKSQLISESMR